MSDVTETKTPEETPQKNSSRVVRTMLSVLELVKAWLALMAQVRTMKTSRRSRTPRPWQIRVGKRAHNGKLTDAEANHLLQRHRNLADLDKIAGAAKRFHLPESDFFGDPQQVERLLRRFLEENPPWLHVARTLAGSTEGTEGPNPELMWREQVTSEMQDVTLYVPEDSWRDLPLSSLTMRPARNLEEVWHARLLDQILPPTVLLDKRNRGEILVPVRQKMRQRLEFGAIKRPMEVVVRKQVPVPIEMEGVSGKGGQLLYILLDYSASMRGKSAILAMACIAATMRANMGQRDTRYLFRRYADAEQLWPSVVEPPLQAKTLWEKDRLLDTILETNFNGGATHVNYALETAVTDILNLRRDEHLEASVFLVTDGRAEILDSTHRRLLEAGVTVHTVMVTKEANPGLARISESFTSLDIEPDIRSAKKEEPTSTLIPALRPRRAYHI